MDSMKGKCASSCVDLGYNNQFCFPEVTSVFFSSCDSVVGDFLEFNQANRGSLCHYTSVLMTSQPLYMKPHPICRATYTLSM